MGSSLLTPQWSPEAVASLVVTSRGQLCCHLSQLPTHSPPVMWTHVGHGADSITEPVLTHGAQQVAAVIILHANLVAISA